MVRGAVVEELDGWRVGGWARLVPARLEVGGGVGCGAVEGAGGWCVCWASVNTATIVSGAVQALYGVFRSMYGVARHGDAGLGALRCGRELWCPPVPKAWGPKEGPLSLES